MKQKIEFIESYIKRGNDYQWNDNHGELIRCEECRHSQESTAGLLCGLYVFPLQKSPRGYCDRGERKEDEE